jgi:hypothetical protein
VPVITSSVYWGTANGLPPPDRPSCGFFNENCPTDFTGIFIVAYFLDRDINTVLAIRVIFEQLKAVSHLALITTMDGISGNVWFETKTMLA